jgi:hypothetical protein
MIFRHTPAPFTFWLKRLVAKLFTPAKVVLVFALSPPTLVCVLCENAHRALFSERGAAFYLEERETINRPAFYADGNKIKALVCSLFVPCSAQKHTETH